MKPIGTLRQWVRRVLVVAALATLIFAAPPAGIAQSQGEGYGKLSREVADNLRMAGTDDFVAVIVQTRGPATDDLLTRARARGAQLKGRHASIDGYTARVPASQLVTLADDPDVEHVSSDAAITAHMDVAYFSTRAAAALQNFPTLDGRGVGVAIVDTGVGTHDDLTRLKDDPALIRVSVAQGSPSVNDGYGHGTHVAGIIGGNGYSSSDSRSFRRFQGLSRKSTLVSIKALADDGTGYTSDIIAAIDWAVANKAVYNIRVLNLSLGHPVFESYTTDPLCRAVRKAWQAGIVVVVAAGNDGQVGSGFGTITSPGNDPMVITVGAMDDRGTASTSDDVLAPYSSKGPSLIDFVAKPDLVAPGTYIQSLRTTGSYLDTAYHDWTLKLRDYKDDPSSADKDGLYYTLSGTSMAAPMVAATAALMIQKEPTLNPDSVKARLMISAAKDVALVFETGAGSLNIDAALKVPGTFTAAPSPTSYLGSDGYIYVDDLSLIWGGSWNLALIWGSYYYSYRFSSPMMLVWGGTKAYAYNIDMYASPDGTTASSGFIWTGRGKAASVTVVENSQVTSNGLIWGSYGSMLMNSTGLVDANAAIWGGRKH